MSEAQRPKRREVIVPLPIGRAVKEMRESRNLSQGKLERLSHRGGGYISMVESDRLMPTLARLDEIAFSLRIETWQLVLRACQLRAMSRN